MWFTKFALEHRTTTLVFAFLLLISGGVAYMTLPREAAPDIKIPIIMVVVPYPGVGPEDVESLITTPLEAELKDVDDLDVLNSTSAEGMSMIQVNFLPDADLSEALTSVRDRVNRVRPELPSDIQEPVINEITSSDWPILMVSISGEAGLVKLKRVAEELEQEIETMDGVLEVDVLGGMEREIRVEVNPHLLTAYGLSLTDITTALSMENVNVPGGPIEEGDLRYTLRVPEEVEDPLQIEDMVVTTKFGHPVRIREVAKVVDDFKEISTISRYRGTEGVSLSVKKQSGANIIKLVDSIKEFIDGRASLFPAGTKVVYLNDYSKFIRQRVDELENNILTALILVVGVLFLFIGGRNALFVAAAIPLSMLMSFVVLQLMGVTLNMVVLFALVLALGMLVDNAIVIVENAYRHTQLGKAVYQAAFDSAKEVAWPVITSTLTTLAVFLPLLNWPGIMGKFFGYLPLTLIVTLSASLFVALVFNPVMCATFMKPGGALKDDDKGPKAAFMRGYRGLLRWSLRHRAIVVGGMVLLFFASFAAYVASNPRIEFFPSSTPERARVNIKAPEGTNLQATNRIASTVERYVDGLDNVKHYQGSVGSGGGRQSSAGSEGTPYLATVSLDFQDRTEWTENPLQTIETIRAFTSAIPGAEIDISKERMGPPAGMPVNVEIAGTDYDLLSEVAEEVIARIHDIPGLTDLNDNYSAGRPELKLRFDRVLSNQLILHGLRIVAGTVRTAVYGTKATSYRLGEEEFDVTVRLQDEYRDSREAVLGLFVAGKEGRQIPLSQVVDLKGSVGSTAIRHVDRKRVITVSGDAEGRPGAEVLREVKNTLASFHPRGATISFTGENKEMVKAQAFLGQALLIGLFLIGMILITQFNSIAQTTIILLSVVLSMMGVAWGLVINQMPFSVMMTGIGVISLAGVVVNNAIILIDFINKLREDGVPLEDALVEAGAVRLRPVLLTAGTTVLGLVPMAQGFDINVRHMTIETGTGSMEFWGPMAISVIYGLAFATVLTLIMVPVLYSLFEGLRVRFGAFLEAHPSLRWVVQVAGLVLVALFAYSLISKLSAMGA